MLNSNFDSTSNSERFYFFNTLIIEIAMINPIIALSKLIAMIKFDASFKNS